MVTWSSRQTQLGLHRTPASQLAHGSVECRPISRHFDFGQIVQVRRVAAGQIVQTSCSLWCLVRPCFLLFTCHFIIHCEAKTITVTSHVLFWKFLAHRYVNEFATKQWQKLSTSPNECHYTTLWNTTCVKLFITTVMQALNVMTN